MGRSTCSRRGKRLAVCSGVTLLGEGLIVGRAADIEGGGKERRDVRDDGHQWAGQGALLRGVHWDDDVLLVPHVKGVWVGVANGLGYVKGAHAVHLAIFCHVLIHRAQQAVLWWKKKEEPR